IALYPTAGDGFATMGTASGKIAQYLHCGVPVVTTRLPSLVSALERYAGAGKIVESADEIPSAVKNFLANPAENRRAAARCFDAEFSFDRAFEKFVARFEACVNTPN
ncbi:glycosyltransferase, partial [Candidatus Sumerlaeota bacterium]|nr:glycosyltransferase [Candidatus Sumerlaeota bacterium]